MFRRFGPAGSLAIIAGLGGVVALALAVTSAQADSSALALQVTSTPEPTPVPPEFLPSPESSVESTSHSCVGIDCEFRVESSTDDAGLVVPFPTVGSCFYSTSFNEIWLGECPDGEAIISGFRFPNVTIPKDALIEEAYLEFTVDGPYDNNIRSEIYGELSPNPEPFGQPPSRPADRSRTFSFLTWLVPSTDPWQLSQTRRTPDLTPVLQEIIDQGNWQPGNAVAFIVEGVPLGAQSDPDPGRRHRRVIGIERPPATYSGDVARLIVRLKELPGPPTGFIRIPLRWCGLQGSPSMEDPGLLGLGTTDRVLINRHLLMNERIFVDQARIRFIVGAREGGFPVFEGTDPEPDETNVGNITNPRTISADAIRRAWNRCRLEWFDKDPDVTGLIALNINRFVDGNRTPDNRLLGYAGRPDPNDVGQQLLEGVASVIDRTYFVPPRTSGVALDPNEKWLGHELGHALSLVHIFPGNNLMDPENVAEIKLKDATKGDPPPDQVGIIRSQALLIPDVVTNPTLPPLGNTLPDVLDDTPPAEMFVDIDTVGLAVDQEEATTHLVASTFGLFPENILGLNYFFAVDLDNNPATGGSPGEIGVPTTTQGVELVGLVQVDVSGGVAQGTPTVWKFQNGQFVQIINPSIRATIGAFDIIDASATQDGSEPELIPTGQILQLILSNAVRGPIAEDIRLIAVTENPNTATVDSVEGSITLTPPTFPACQVSPSGALRGSAVTVTADTLPESSAVEVLLGTEQVATGSTDSEGNASIDFAIPSDAATGTRQILVHAVGTAVAADCLLQLSALPEFDVPPSPPSGSIFTVEVGQTVTFSIQASDADVSDVVTLGVIGLPAGASFPIPAPSIPTAATFSWTPTVEQIGSQVVVFTAVDSTGLSATPHSIGLNVPTRVDIDIKPGSDPNSINCNNDKQFVSVAILTTEGFDATTVDHTTVSFEGASETHVGKKSGEPRRHEVDVDGDGDIDLVFHFRMGETGLGCGSAGGTLFGETFDGPAIIGADAILMLDKGGGKP